MDDKKQEENTGVTPEVSEETVVSSEGEQMAEETVAPVPSTEVTAPQTEIMPAEVVVSKDVVSEAPVAVTTEAHHTSFNVRAYVGAVIVILLISAGLLFVLEKEGRISTGLFSGIIGKMEASLPAARVNDEVISKKEFDSSLQQLTQMAVSQGGGDVTDPAFTAELKKQAIDTLVNAVLLRQAALAEGMTATEEEIEIRFAEIRDGIGGAELLAARMAEFGVTEVSLRRDIENEFLIQRLFDAKITTDALEVSEEEIANFYKTQIQTYYQNAGTEAEIPKIEEVRDQIVAQLELEKKQVLINEYLETLRADASIEILI